MWKVATKMKIPSKIVLISAGLLTLAACGKEESRTTGGKLDAVEVQEGTISDNMITLDQIATDGTAIDTSTPVDSSRKAAPKPVEAPAEEAPATDTAAAAPAAPPAASSAASN
jgi:hypothetical protein